MSEMVLRLPSSYVDVERDEMEYVDGGIGVTRYNKGFTLWLNSTETNRFAVGSSAIAAAVGVAIGIPSWVAGALITAFATFRGALITYYNNNSGIVIDISDVAIGRILFSGTTGIVYAPIRDRW